MTTSHDDAFFIKNAIACWLHHYPDHMWTDKYNQLLKSDVLSCMDANDRPPPKPRPARRRKPKTIT